jgi:hypothetical protein
MRTDGAKPCDARKNYACYDPAIRCIHPAGVSRRHPVPRDRAIQAEPAADFLVGEVLAGLPVADRDLLAVIAAGGSTTASTR